MQAATESAQRVKRTWKSASKSRQGCAKCKSRRIGCDENRPACKNCTRLGHICPGFQQQLRWSDKHERHQPQPQSQDVAVPGRREHDSATTQVVDTEIIPSTSRNRFDSLTIGTTCNGISPLYTTADLGLNIGTSSSRGEGSNSAVFEGSESLHHLQSPTLAQTLVHTPTALVEHWFRYVCPTRCTFDSDTNYTRQLAYRTWGASEAVFYTLQATSAAIAMPHFVRDLRAQAVAAVDQGVARVRTAQARVTVDLIFAVFVLGTSLSGTPAAAENSWSELAHELLMAWGVPLLPADVLIHAYFCQALTHWDMVLAAVGGGSIPDRVNRKRRQHEQSHSDLDGSDSEALSYPPGLNLLGTRPNSWCGVSNEVIDLFGQVLALCNTESRRGSACGVSLAHELQMELLAMDFDTLVLMDEANGYFVETRDDKTPLSHLLQTAEAYRQAALLQLHLAFDYLPAGAAPRAEFLLGLVLRLLGTLEQIPLDSGSRTIHPMLYLSAATGLRALEYSRSADPSEPCSSQQTAVEISSARQVILTRLELLPHSTSGSMLQFVSSMWRQFGLDRSRGYWTDVLRELGSGLIL